MENTIPVFLDGKQVGNAYWDKKINKQIFNVPDNVMNEKFHVTLRKKEDGSEYYEGEYRDILNGQRAEL